MPTRCTPLTTTGVRLTFCVAPLRSIVSCTGPDDALIIDTAAASPPLTVDPALALGSGFGTTASRTVRPLTAVITSPFCRTPAAGAAVDPGAQLPLSLGLAHANTVATRAFPVS